MRLRLEHKWKTDAHYNRTERRFCNGRITSRYVKTQASREQRRNSKAITRYELELKMEE